MKFYVVVNYYLGSLCYKFHEDPCTNAHAQVVNARTCDKTCACALICTRIFMKFLTLAHKIVIDPHIKFHDDWSFHLGDICKTILVFV